MTSRAEPTPGDALADRYVLERRIGTGGAGVVWRAHDDVLGRLVAVKLLHPELAQDPANAARFRAEATAAARLTHPNAVVVFDIGRDGDRDYLVMELVDGPDLAEVLHGRPMAPEVVAHVGRAIAAALGAAHARGLVHRDVKPGNVLVTREGVPKVADFGIARAVGDAMARLTRPGNVMGTARYVAPEQLRDGQVDARADVYALGLVLHEALTGETPWGHGTATEVAVRRLSTDLVPVSSFRDDVPPGLDAAIARATRLDPDERHEDGAELAAALLPFVHGDAAAILAAQVNEVADGHAPPPSPTPPRHHESTHAVTPRRPAGDMRPPRTSAGDHADRSAPPTPPSPDGDGTRVLGTPVPAHRAAAPTSPTVASGATTHVGQRDAATQPPPPAPPRRRRRTWLLVLVALAIAGVVGVLGILDGSLPTPTSAQLSDVPVSDVGDHDPLGDRRERTDLLEGAVDGDDDTSWQTETYRGADLIPPDKTGVGIWFDLGEARDVRRLELDLVTAGADLEIWAGDDVPGPGARPDEWGTRVEQVEGAGQREALRFDGTTARVWLVWFTRLPPADDGYRAHIGDVRFRAR